MPSLASSGRSQVARSIILAFVLAAPACTALPPQDGSTSPPTITADIAGIGTGRLWLASYVATAYEQFKKSPDRKFFAVAKNGRAYGYSSRWEKAIAWCEKFSRGVPCFLYADRNGVLWKGEVTILESVSDYITRTAPPIPPEGPSRPVTLIQCRLPDGFVIAMVPERCKLVGGVPE